jgi:hypothetical protein
MRRMNTTMTSLLTIGGLALAVMQMMRMRSRPTGWRMATHWVSRMMNQMTRGSTQMMGGANRMMRTVRRRVNN